MNDYGIHKFRETKEGEASQSSGSLEADSTLSPLLQKDGAGLQQQKNRMRQQKQQQQYQRQPQQQRSTSMDVDKIKWQQNLMAAKEVWGRLTDDELLESEGDLKKLSALVSDRYAISRCEADKQIENFLNKINDW